MMVTIELTDREWAAIMQMQCPSPLCKFSGPEKKTTQSYCNCVADATSDETVVIFSVIKKVFDQLTGNLEPAILEE